MQTPPESSDSSPGIFGGQWALRLGVALLIGYAVITGFAVYDKSRRSGLEKALSPTAVADKAFFKVAESFDASVPLVNFEGRSLYFVDWKYMLDSVMIRAGMDDSNTVAVYTFSAATKDETRFLYLKIKPGYYMQTKRQ